MSERKHEAGEAEERDLAYEAPRAEDLETQESPSVTAAGATKTPGI